jgi:soluble lytic murein transglycosylase-like protein
MTEKSIKEEAKYEKTQKQIRRNVKIAERVYRRLGCRTTYAEATGKIAFEYGISARLLAAVVFTESSCNPKAVSGRDSVGLLQINPKVWHYTRSELKNPERNLEIGARILSAYIHMYGLVQGLHAYNGFGTHNNSYAAKVYTAAGFAIDFPIEGMS